MNLPLEKEVRKILKVARECRILDGEPITKVYDEQLKMADMDLDLMNEEELQPLLDKLESYEVDA